MMLTDQDLDKLEISRQKDSDWILERLSLIPKLKKYGEIHIVGAKALGLMLAKDIDISVVVDEINYKIWQTLVGELMITPWVRRVLTIDDYNYDNENNYDPVNGKRLSLYIALEKVLGPEGDRFDTWEVQVHLIKTNIFDAKIVEDIKKKITPEKRITILRLKNLANKVNEQLYCKVKDNFKINSQYIYKAVLDENINSEEEFINYFRKFIEPKYRETFELALEG